MSSESKFMATMGGFLFGAAAGAVAMFLLAPRSGKENRKMIQDRVEELSDYIEDERSLIEDKVEEIFGEVNALTTSLFNDARKLWNDQVRTFEKSMDKIDKNKYLEMVDNVMEKLQSSKKYNNNDLTKVKRYLSSEWRKFSQMMD
ncbi:MAG: YtxH domain-containing protein [bacterium]|nr:YtxH domain-containing protein [bacterium]